MPRQGNVSAEEELFYVYHGWVLVEIIFSRLKAWFGILFKRKDTFVQGWVEVVEKAEVYFVCRAFDHLDGANTRNAVKNRLLSYSLKKSKFCRLNFK